jgi:Ca2+-dependent lipid-binding protein
MLQNNDLNPIWNEHYEFVVEDSSTQHLTVKVYDDEGLQPSEIIGCARVELAGLQPGKVKDVWLELVKDLEIQRDKKPRGQVSCCTFQHNLQLYTQVINMW